MNNNNNKIKIQQALDRAKCIMFYEKREYESICTL